MRVLSLVVCKLHEWKVQCLKKKSQKKKKKKLNKVINI